MGLDDRDARYQGRERSGGRSRRPDAYNDYDNVPPAGRSSSRASYSSGGGSRGDYRSDRSSRRDYDDAPASRSDPYGSSGRRSRGDGGSGSRNGPNSVPPRSSRSSRDGYDDRYDDRRGGGRDPRDQRERAWDAPSRSGGSRRPPADDGWGDGPNGTMRRPRPGGMDRGDMGDPRRGPRTPRGNMPAGMGMGMGGPNGMGMGMGRGQAPRGGLNGRMGGMSAAATAEPEQKRGISIGTSLGIIVLMLAIGIGGAYGYFLLSTPKVQGDTSGGTAPASTVPATTPTTAPSTTPSTTPHSFIWVTA